MDRSSLAKKSPKLNLSPYFVVKFPEIISLGNEMANALLKLDAVFCFRFETVELALKWEDLMRGAKPMGRGL